MLMQSVAMALENSEMCITGDGFIISSHISFDPLPLDHWAWHEWISITGAIHFDEKSSYDEGGAFEEGENEEKHYGVT